MTDSDGRNSQMAKKGARCPVCGKEAVTEFRPFCSRRCSEVDLNRWLSGVYRIETNEAPADAEKSPEPPPKSGE
jgi:endogenous inhibitor of DNA gyrase (YacG/DUF329 family)